MNAFKKFVGHIGQAWCDRIVTSMRTARSGAGRFGRNERGASAIDFAFSAPILLIIILGCLEVSMDIMMDANLQSAVEMAGRAGLTLSAQPAGYSSREAYATAIVNNAMSVWTSVPGTTLTLTPTAYESYGNLGTSQSTANSAGASGNIVMYTVVLQTPGVTGMLKFFGIPYLNFTRNFIVQNEQTTS